MAHLTKVITLTITVGLIYFFVLLLLILTVLQGKIF